MFESAGECFDPPTPVAGGGSVWHGYLFFPSATNLTARLGGSWGHQTSVPLAHLRWTLVSPQRVFIIKLQKSEHMGYPVSQRCAHSSLSNSPQTLMWAGQYRSHFLSWSLHKGEHASFNGWEACELNLQPQCLHLPCLLDKPVADKKMHAYVYVLIQSGLAEIKSSSFESVEVCVLAK